MHCEPELSSCTWSHMVTLYHSNNWCNACELITHLLYNHSNIRYPVATQEKLWSLPRASIRSPCDRKREMRCKNQRCSPGSRLNTFKKGTLKTLFITLQFRVQAVSQRCCILHSSGWKLLSSLCRMSNIHLILCLKGQSNCSSG